MLSPTFDLFETLCNELRTRETCIISEDSLLGTDEENEEKAEALKREYHVSTIQEAFEKAISALHKHFRRKGGSLPFGFRARTRSFWVADKSYIDFVTTASSIRRIGAKSKEFEMQALSRLSDRLTGVLHRVGAPRKRERTVKEFSKYLRRLGFSTHPLERKDKDGGFDILWLPPLGTVPLRPIVSLQCKNSFFSFDGAAASVVKATRTLNRHSVLRGQGVFLNYVIFNDYISTKVQKPAVGFPFVPLGLSDLSTLGNRLETIVL